MPISTLPRFKRLGLALALTFSALSAHAGLAIQNWTTPSGSKVFFVESRALPIVDVQVDFRAAGTEVPAGKAGLAGLTRGLLDAGAGALDEEAIANRVADLGAQIGGGADMDRASLSLRTLSSPAERDGAVELVATLIQQPRFPQAALEREKARSIAGIRESETQPDAILARRFAAAVFPDHAYGRLPTADSVASLTRDELVAFHARHYTARGATVSIVGDLSRAEAEAVAARLTAGLPVGEAVATDAFDLPCRWVIHTVGPVWQGGDHHEAERLEEAYFNSLQLALANGYQSIAFPAISTGAYGYPRAAAAEIAVKTVLKFITRRALPDQIYFVCFDDENAQLYKRLLTQQGDDHTD